MYQQLDFSMSIMELDRAVHSPDFYRDYLTDLMKYANSAFGDALPFFPFIGDGQREFDFGIVENAPKKKTKSFDLAEILDELAECKAEAEKIKIADEDLQKSLFNLIDEVKRRAELFPGYFADGFEEMYAYVMRRLSSAENSTTDNSRMKADIMRLIGRLKKVHITVNSVVPETVYGRYIPSQRRIELYAAPIRKAFWNDRDRTDFLLCVLAHELFHLWHHAYILQGGGKLSGGKKATAVKESLARSFEYAYSRDCNQFRDKVKDFITRMTYLHLSLFPDNPYHGAMYIDRELFGELVKISAFSLSDAFTVLNARHLLCEYDKGSFKNPI